METINIPFSDFAFLLTLPAVAFGAGMLTMAFCMRSSSAGPKASTIVAPKTVPQTAGAIRTGSPQFLPQETE
jgi:hypothetical protein